MYWRGSVERIEPAAVTKGEVALSLVANSVPHNASSNSVARHHGASFWWATQDTDLVGGTFDSDEPETENAHSLAYATYPYIRLAGSLNTRSVRTDPANAGPAADRTDPVNADAGRGHPTNARPIPKSEVQLGSKAEDTGSLGNLVLIPAASDPDNTYRHAIVRPCLRPKALTGSGCEEVSMSVRVRHRRLNGGCHGCCGGAQFAVGWGGYGAFCQCLEFGPHCFELIGTGSERFRCIGYELSKMLWSHGRHRHFVPKRGFRYWRQFS